MKVSNQNGLARVTQLVTQLTSFGSSARRRIVVIAGLAALAAGILLSPGCTQKKNLPSGRLEVELVHVRAKDDVVNGGAVFVPPQDPVRPIAVIWVHGWGVNFYQPSYVNVGTALARRGITCIMANTRMHDLGNVAGQRDGKRLRGGGYWGVASEEARDLAAWIDFAEA